MHQSQITSSRNHTANQNLLKAATWAASAVAVAYLLLNGTDTYPSTVLAYVLFCVGIVSIACWTLWRGPSIEARSTMLQLLPILLLALSIRLVAAQLPGHAFDLPINMGWAKSAAQLGLIRSYKEQIGGNILPNYPPVIMGFYWLTGLLYQGTISPAFDSLLPSYAVIIRFPAIFADLVVCCVIAVVAQKLDIGRRWTWPSLAYALHPVAIYDSSIWGQTDSIYALWMLLALFAIALRHWAIAGLWTACALLTKPQAAAMLPVMLTVAARGWPKGMAFLGGAAFATLAILVPFAVAGAIDPVTEVYRQTVGGYHNGVSIGAHNFWAIFNRTARLSDNELAFELISFRASGLVLLSVATAAILWRLRQSLYFPVTPRQRLLGVLLSAALTTSAMFIFATEMHERYQFAYVVLALPVAIVTRRGAVLYAATSVLIFVNILGALAFGPFPPLLVPKVVGVLQIVLFVATLWAAPRLVLEARPCARR